MHAPFLRPLRSAIAVSVAAIGTVSVLTLAFAAPSNALATPEVAGTTVHVANGAPRWGDTQSDNWSGYDLGYLSTNTLYTSISGTWIVPTAKQETSGQAEHGATWIGIGGGCLNTSCSESDNTLIQAGTEQDISKAGKASYSAWYEIIPETSTTESITVHPGDTVNCSITQTSTGEWTIVLKDATDGQSFTKQLQYSSDYSTAEWIVETPVTVGTGGTGISSLPNLGDVHFKKAEVNGSNANLAPDNAMQLVNSDNQPIATPSNPNKKGNAFVDCTYATTCTL
ncbi:MAG: G1 family glutamic endopeptidase [Acidimicrobiales bacterium]